MEAFERSGLEPTLKRVWTQAEREQLATTDGVPGDQEPVDRPLQTKWGGF